MLSVLKKEHPDYGAVLSVYYREGSPRHVTALGRQWRVVKGTEGIYFVEVMLGGISAKYGGDSFGSGGAGRTTIQLKPEHADLPENDAAPQNEAKPKSRRLVKPESGSEE